jgi:hypothetical protein
MHEAMFYHNVTYLKFGTRNSIIQPYILGSLGRLYIAHPHILVQVTTIVNGFYEHVFHPVARNGQIGVVLVAPASKSRSLMAHTNIVIVGMLLD